MVPRRYYENRYDDDSVLVRPYATFPHDWQAVRIADGPCSGPDLQDRFLSRGDAAERGRSRPRPEVRPAHWSDRAAGEEPWTALSADDSDAVWQLVLDFQSVTLFALSDAVNESLDATLAGQPRRRDPAARPKPSTWPGSATRSPARVRRARTPGSTELMLCAAELSCRATPRADRRVAAPPELSSDPPIGHHFAEGVYQFWIRPDDLAARRFDLVELTASAY